MGPTAINTHRRSPSLKRCFCFPSIVLAITVVMILRTAESTELRVGGDDGWAVPSPKSGQLYDDWASENRFQVNDTLRFVYKKDSVLVVTEEEYEKCRSSHPMFFFNNGDTLFALDRPGLFYFISGVSGHCQRGLKMIVKVLDPPPQSQDGHSSSAAAAAANSALFIPIPCLFLYAFVL